MYVFEGFVTIDKVACFSAWVAWCCYFRVLFVIFLVDICSKNVVSDGLHFMECN